MRLISITGKNYRTLKDISIAFAKNYCTIAGRSNAGKSCVIRLLSTLFGSKPPYPWAMDEFHFDYKEDKTQWVRQNVPIHIDYVVELTKDEDPALISFVEKIASTRIEEPTVSLRISYSVSEGDALTVAMSIDGQAIDEKAAKGIEKRIKDSNLFFSITPQPRTRSTILGAGATSL